MQKVAIIGSGLTALATAKALIRVGIKPTIYDIGKDLDPDIEKLKQKLSKEPPRQWVDSERVKLTGNPTVHNKDQIPRKLVFGSDYFYGREKSGSHTGLTPPFSQARGGFSAGWGASILPADPEDLRDWPIRDFSYDYKDILKELPLSGKVDQLENTFPLYKDNLEALPLTTGNRVLLNKLEQYYGEDTSLTFGQSRIMVKTNLSYPEQGCKLCGFCMSGCVYNCIYKSSFDLDQLILNGQVSYQKAEVKAFQKSNKGIKLTFHHEDASESQHYDRIFIAAGAVGSTKIVMQSLRAIRQIAHFHGTGSFILPLFSLRRNALNWPDHHTFPGVFLEYKNKKNSSVWNHTQISTPNELVFQKVGYDFNKRGIVNKLKKHLLEHLFVAHCNLHAQYSPGYSMKMTESKRKEFEYEFEYRENPKSQLYFKQSQRRLSQILRPLGLVSLKPFIQDTLSTGGAFHLGGTIPMKKEPTDQLHCDLLGQPMEIKNVHLVDSSVFPSVPATTVGLLAMANANRIVRTIYQ